ncbi:hypothetical protein SAMN05192529_1466 [Arachidicoccus rhizosphaerae]|uniref:Uncharacterized protein n=1 Tax=Arachidicoccus rhizosphaerae TaxID=551991 RepID=A0A1H4D5V3_9BACT|nr:hypothetical protein [Arachidicoccus rhizosphaerae]SEA68104.1 hypothetical protein SAMN05192529_1466 [Arachidicoccus rhizosphaerae]
MEQSIIINFLKSFFTLFKAKIEEYKIVNKKIFGTVGWLNEEDRQDFVFKIDFDTLILSRVKSLCDFLYEMNLVNGDKIIVSENNLLEMLKKEGWSRIDAKEAVDGLCSLEVKMVDEGEETDSFFVHF